MKLKFNVDAWYNGVLLYRAGEIHEVTEELGFANRWLKRGAEEVIEAPIEAVIEVEKKEELIETEPVQSTPPKTKRGKHFSKAHKEL